MISTLLAGIDIKAILTFLKWGSLIIGVVAVFSFIKDAGRKDEQIKIADEKVIYIQKQMEMREDVQKTINRVVSDPAYRDRVRSQYDSKPKR